MKRQFALLLTAAALTFSLSQVSFAADFSDMDQLPWEGAKDYIDSVSKLGIMVGDTDGKSNMVFRPKDKVTYCEVVQLAYALLEKADKLQPTGGLLSKWESFMKENNIPAWAHESVAYALEYKAVNTRSDIKQFMKVVNGAVTNNYASRQDVAVIFGKELVNSYAVAEKADADATLNFADASEVAKTSTPYVDLLSKLKIMIGDQRNEFNPNRYINRSEIAVVVHNTYSVLSKGEVLPPETSSSDTSGEKSPSLDQGAETFAGQIVQINKVGDTVVIALDKDNQGFVLQPATVVEDTEGDVLDIADIGLGDQVEVYHTNGKVGKVVITEALAGEENAIHIEGKISEIYGDEIYVNKSDGGMQKYTYASNLKTTLDEADATLKQVMDAYEEGTVQVKLTLNGNGEVSRLDGETDAKTGIVGTLTEVTEKKLEFKKANGSRVSFYFSDKPEIKMDGSSSSYSKLQSAMKSEEVYATVYVNGKNEAVKVIATRTMPDELKAATDSAKGTVYSITSSSIRLEDSNGSRKRYMFDDKVKIYLDNDSVDWDDIEYEIERAQTKNKTLSATLTLDSDEYVTRIDVGSAAKTDSQTKTGRLTAMTKRSMTLDGTTYTVKDYNTDLKMRIEDGTKESTITEEDELRQALEEDGKTIEATFTLSGSNTVSKAEGEVTKLSNVRITLVNIRDNTVRIQTDKGKGNYFEYEFLDDPEDVEISIAGKHSKTVGDLKARMDDGVLLASLILEDGQISEVVAEYN